MILQCCPSFPGTVELAVGQSNTLGLLSSDLSVVASFIALTASSAFETSVLVRVQRSASPFLTWGESKAAQIAACCSKKRSTISYVLFHLGLTSVISLWHGRPSSFCLSSWYVPTVLWWANETMRLVLARILDSAGNLSACWQARLKVWAKHLACMNPPKLGSNDNIRSIVCNYN